MDRGQRVLEKPAFIMPPLNVEPRTPGWILKHTDELGQNAGGFIKSSLEADWVQILNWDTFNDCLMYIPDTFKEIYSLQELNEMFGNDYLVEDLMTLDDLFWTNSKVVSHQVSGLRLYDYPGYTSTIGSENLDAYIKSDLGLYCIEYKSPMYESLIERDGDALDSVKTTLLYCLVYYSPYADIGMNEIAEYKPTDIECRYCYFTIPKRT